MEEACRNFAKATHNASSELEKLRQKVNCVESAMLQGQPSVSKICQDIWELALELENLKNQANIISENQKELTITLIEKSIEAKNKYEELFNSEDD